MALFTLLANAIFNHEFKTDKNIFNYQMHSSTFSAAIL